MTDTTPAETMIADVEEQRNAQRAQIEKWAKWLAPLCVMIGFIATWHIVATTNESLQYILPGPGKVFLKLLEDWRDVLAPATWVTARLTLLALLAAVVGGVSLAVLFTQSRWVEMSFYPFAVILQVTPVLAIAPLLAIVMDSAFQAALMCAWIVAFFPILSNTTTGLKSADHNLQDLFTIYGATRWQKLRYLLAPAALPFFLSGLRIAGGLALIGAVVAEFVIGRSGTGLGLASTLLEASYRFNFGRFYAALILISILGIVIFACTSLISHLLLRKWHESALKRDG
ncbi:MAG: ABC transporter permease [Pseudomonadota bacterium]